MTKLEEIDQTYQLYGAKVYKVAFHFTKNQEKAVKLTTEAFLMLYNNLEQISPTARCAYLIVTVKKLFEKQQTDS